jgi:Cu(I)/Ag(I) efflux system membrane fusion protein/cobalt-zinc-cadmium efflux system membrane fusion protein
MTANARVFGAVLLAFLLGAAAPFAVLWNPGGWEWADHLAGRDHAAHEEVSSSPEEKQLWTCGMHPQVIQEEPGNCPICGMRLVPVARGTAEGSDAVTPPAARGERKIKYWRAPMDPGYISDKPGKSPMGMDLVPVYEDETGTESGVRVDPNFLQNFGVRTAVAEKGAAPVEIRTVGILSHNEKNVVSVNTKFEGWIEKAYYNNIGEHVHQGELLFEIYGPQLVSTQKEYLAAKSYLSKLEASGYPDAIERARSLLEAARERLRYWDIADEQIAEIEQSGTAIRTLKVMAPASGHIVGKATDFLEGMRVMPGMVILKLADHSTLWAEVEFYEDQVRHVRQGQGVIVEVDAIPGRRWTGRIDYFNPFVNPETRTLKAFVEISNKDFRLRPQMFANVIVRAPATVGAVRVPQEAVLHSGERSIVIVEKSRGLFEPREVTLGPSGGGYQEIRSGVEPGETVVTSSQFLIDSESNLKAAISQMMSRRPGEGPSEAPPPIHQH